MNRETEWPWLHWSITGPGEVWHWKQLKVITAIQFADGRSVPPIGSILERWAEPDYPTPCEILWAGVLRGEWVLIRPWEKQQTFQELLAEALSDPISRELLGLFP